ncbi:MAG: histidine kinase [Polaribacter sp.]|uniref:sensor histidine kinase n=1 Tax=Polaribacter sp. TaxID=1920175 RepID=UPI003262E6B0
MNTKLNKSDWTLLAIIYGVTIFLNIIDYYREGNYLIEYIVDFPLYIIISLSLILFFLHILIPKFLVYKKDYLRFFMYTIAILTLGGSIDNFIGHLTAGKDITKISSIILFLQNGLYNASDMIGLPIGILLVKKLYEGKTELLEVEKKQKENELKLLRSQIDPHFLFNNLNTLDSLIDTQPIKAKEYINRLSLIYRYLIKTKDAEVMELSNEIEFAKNYIFLIKTRFGDDYEFTIKENITLKDKFIPTGAIQALLENVVKHNKSDGISAIKTTITINKGWLIITNSKSKIKSTNESFGTGLDNLKARYKLLSDEKIQIHNMDAKFEVFIPIITLSE